MGLCFLSACARRPSDSLTLYAGWELFAREGCPHVAAAAVVAPEVAARIRHQPDAVAGVAAFLGGF